ncbi:Uncharacterized protein APZ42_003831 [Daphnia magna]|uniref:Uncharacterized protein n=1 Tax=Daphnia magna TaxID=35525 RepID=A0A164HEH6_9CRUS|nr:Uncharacterized protein APZ42_003831 [Daphnia magna]
MERSLKSVRMQSIDLVKTMNWGLFGEMQKGKVSEKCWNVVNTAGEITMKWGLFEECERERCLKSVEMQYMELMKTQ